MSSWNQHTFKMISISVTGRCAAVIRASMGDSLQRLLHRVSTVGLFARHLHPTRSMCAFMPVPPLRRPQGSAPAAVVIQKPVQALQNGMLELTLLPVLYDSLA